MRWKSWLLLALAPTLGCGGRVVSDEEGEASSEDTGPLECAEDLGLRYCEPAKMPGTCGECDDACEEAATVLQEQVMPAACFWTLTAISCGPVLDDGQCCYYAHFQDNCDTAGRPFIVDGRAIVAATIERSDWSEPRTPELARLSADERRRLGEHWARTGLTEHASVASFARFVLDLLAIGAPAELVHLAQAAMHEEIVHTELAFGLASAYLDRPVGPGPLAGSDGPRTLERIVGDAIVEGCIGEAIAAAVAFAESEAEPDPVVRDVLRTIADDERGHAQLAWRFVAWALAAHPELREPVTRTFDEALGRDDNPQSRAVLEAVVRPCAGNLLRADPLRAA